MSKHSESDDNVVLPRLLVTYATFDVSVLITLYNAPTP